MTAQDDKGASRKPKNDSNELQPQWYDWGSPIGLGVFLLCVGGLLVLLALGLDILSSIN